jgi:hypothetical protein
MKMNYPYSRILLPVAYCLLSIISFAQTLQRHKIAIFTPLYLDSVYDAAGNFRFEKSNFPKFAVPGLEFYQGAQAALDSLQKRGAPLEVFIYDSRSRQTIPQQLSHPELKGLEMIIAQSNASETKTLADAALQKKIPFISTTLPNDAGVANNPYFVVLNATLQAHVEGIYNFLQRYHSQDKIVFFTRPGAQETQLKEYINEYSKNTASTPLKIKFVEIGNAFTAQTLAASLDSTKKNVCIAGSLNEAFGQRLVQELENMSSSYPIRVLGMPTWDHLNLSKFSGIEIIYSTPFYYNRSSTLENKLAEDFSDAFSSKPSDLYFRGYESTLRFALLLLDTKKDIASNLTRKGNTIFTQFDIQPVFKDKSTMTLDYFENKHLYFIKVFGGVKNIIY